MLKVCWSIRLVLVLMVCQFASGTAFAGIVCPPLESRHGNNDYLNPANQGELGLVERRHFTQKIRSLHPRGQTGSLIGDLEYTLRWFPNHHPALELLVRLALREKNPMPLGAVHIECRFQWAAKVNPRDGMVPWIHAHYRYQLGQHEQARRLLEQATALAPNNANVQYNVGLTYFGMKDYEAARAHAARAYQLGFPLPGLRNMLERAGYPLRR